MAIGFWEALIVLHMPQSFSPELDESAATKTQYLKPTTYDHIFFAIFAELSNMRARFRH